MKISVVTPSYNQGRFIQKCIDSVKAQQGVQVEHIILDNCSTDQTVDLLNKYRNDPQGVDVKIIIEPDKGQTAAINRGFLMATGDVVCWLNTDEYYDTDALAKVISYFEKNSYIDFLFGNCTYVDENGHPVRRQREVGFSRSMLLYTGCFIRSCSAFVRRRIINDGQLLNEKYKVTMDFEWYVRLAYSDYQFAFTPLSVAYFTWHNENLSVLHTARRHIESAMVRDKFSGIRGPKLFRLTFYKLIKVYWLFIRIFLRSFSRTIYFNLS